ncbi:unnamed protein product [marine sediment metagenome]|uniref:Uncharacterized protein n=1 Tax=marine sediment metagenome TaxID=412755 RepID=X1BU36_9ZZZZ
MFDLSVESTVTGLSDQMGIIGIYGDAGTEDPDTAPVPYYIYIGATNETVYNKKATLKIDAEECVGIGISGDGRPDCDYRLHVNGSVLVEEDLNITGNITAGESFVGTSWCNASSCYTLANFLDLGGAAGLLATNGTNIYNDTTEGLSIGTAKSNDNEMLTVEGGVSIRSSSSSDYDAPEFGLYVEEEVLIGATTFLANDSKKLILQLLQLSLNHHHKSFLKHSNYFQSLKDFHHKVFPQL